MKRGWFVSEDPVLGPKFDTILKTGPSQTSSTHIKTLPLCAVTALKEDKSQLGHTVLFEEHKTIHCYWCHSIFARWSQKYIQSVLKVSFSCPYWPPPFTYCYRLEVSVMHCLSMGKYYLLPTDVSVDVWELKVPSDFWCKADICLFLAEQRSGSCRPVLQGNTKWSKYFVVRI